MRNEEGSHNFGLSVDSLAQASICCGDLRAECPILKHRECPYAIDSSNCELYSSPCRALLMEHLNVVKNIKPILTSTNY